MGCDVIQSLVEKGQWMPTSERAKQYTPPRLHLHTKVNLKVDSQEMSLTTQKQTMTLSGSYSSTLKPKPNRSVYCIFRVKIL